MARKPVTDMSAWPSLSLEGNLIAPAMVAAVDRREAEGQKEADYRIRKGLTVREEISTAFRVGQSHFDAFAKLVNPSSEATNRFVRAFLQETFGYDDLATANGALSFIAGARVPVVVVPPSDEKLDRRSATLSTDRTRSPAFALQDYLNEHDDTLWGLVTNGTLIRLMRDNASLTRPAYIEADLAQIFTNEDAASFTILWLLIHRTRFGVAGSPASDCALERWRDAGSREGEVARDRLAVQVQIALKVLGSGFLEANPNLATKLKSGEVNLTEWFNELLRLVYRLIFLMVAEDRNLLHPEKANPEPRKLYAEGYSLAALRAQCYRATSWEKHHDRYEGIKIVFRALAHGQDALALPALGGLFSDDKLPHFETARLRNKAFMEALYRLSWLTDKTGMVPVNWRAMETEELGSVYESLLELQPQLGDDGISLVFASEAAEQKGNQRKTTGSYYTPDSLVQALLDTALDPVLDRTEAEAADPAKALLNLSVIDPACGSGHFLLAAARRIATRLARIRTEGTPSLSDFRHALRDVARSCLHGVDRNPMAVELTKVALWIETVDPGLPLGFFDAQIRCGDSLLGVFNLKSLEKGIPDGAYKALSGDEKETAKHFAKRNKSESDGQGTLDFARGGGALPAVRQFADLGGKLRNLPEATLADIDAKVRQYHALCAGADWLRWKTACDLYVAAFLAPKTGGVPANRNAVAIPTTAHLWEVMAGHTIYGPLVARADALAQAARAFHWPLEFPDVMAAGGFDVVLGNPPWEVMQLKEEEYFAQFLPEVAELVGESRKRAITSLAKERPTLFNQYQSEKRRFEAANQFARSAGRFELTTSGKINTYGLFAELFASLISARGRSGMIVPTGLVTDANSRAFLAELIQLKRLISMVSFDNRRALFPAVHRDTSFGMLTIGESLAPPMFANELLDTNQIGDERRRYRLDARQLALINPNTGNAPVFRSCADAELTGKIYSRVPVFVDEARGPTGNPWSASFLSMFNMASDSRLFQTAAQLQEAGYIRDGLDWILPKEFGARLPGRPTKAPRKLSRDVDLAEHEGRCVPLYEGKMIEHFDHRGGSFEGLRVRPPRGASLPPTGPEQHGDSQYEPTPWYWVPWKDVSRILSGRQWDKGWTLGYRFGANPANERTVYCTAIPRAATPHVFIQILAGSSNISMAGAVLLANLNAIVLDYVCRQKMARPGLDIFIMKQLPILPPSSYTAANLAFIVPRALELTYTSNSMAPFALDLGYDGPPFKWDEDRRAHLRADLDTFYARAYGLTRDELRYILDPADVKGPDYPSETFRVLKEKEIRDHGEYRTRRLVLAAWDRMEANGEFAALGM